MSFGCANAPVRSLALDVCFAFCPLLNRCVVCSFGPGDVSMRALLKTSAAKLAGKLGVEEDFGAFCADRGKADIAALQAALDAHMLERQRAALN